MGALQVRKACTADLPEMMRAYRAAQEYMVSTGNVNQWKKGFPPEEFIAAEISRGVSYVIESEKGDIEGCFSMIPGKDPTYTEIYGGEWLNDAPYCTIHKLASAGRVPGIFDTMLEYAAARFDNVRADTHKDNATMQHLMLSRGFRYCGIIHLANGDPRNAYHLSVLS